jgi:hypothetical protein
MQQLRSEIFKCQVSDGQIETLYDGSQAVSEFGSAEISAIRRNRPVDAVQPMNYQIHLMRAGISLSLAGFELIPLPALAIKTTIAFLVWDATQ